MQQKPKPAYVIFTGDITAQNIEAMIRTLSDLAQKRVKEVYLAYSSSGGGFVGFELYNFLRGVPFELIVHNIGCVFSMGAPIFLAADTRFASPQSTFKFHDFHWNPGNRNYSQADLRLMADEVNIHQGFAEEILVERTSVTPEQAKEFLSRSKDHSCRTGSRTRYRSENKRL